MFITWFNICYFLTINKVFTSSAYIYIILIKIKVCNKVYKVLTPNHEIHIYVYFKKKKKVCISNFLKTLKDK